MNKIEFRLFYEEFSSVHPITQKYVFSNELTNTTFKLISDFDPKEEKSLSGSATFILLLFLFILLTYTSSLKKKCLLKNQLLKCNGLRSQSELPGPKPWPLIGSLHLLHGHKIPFAAFTFLKDKLGDIFSIQMGSLKCVVINNQTLFREVLISKGADFDSRPNFTRLHVLFGGDKQNSLAFCDYDGVQVARRHLLKSFTFLHTHSHNWTRMNKICQDENKKIIGILNSHIGVFRKGCIIDMKDILSKACANIFNEYFCSTDSINYGNEFFSNYVRDFDAIFWEVNNGKACDFLPWMLPFMYPYMSRLACKSKKIRLFVLQYIINEKLNKNLSKLKKSNNVKNEFEVKDEDFLDALLKLQQSNHEKILNNNDTLSNCALGSIALYALEDILGGHCAVSSITLRILNDLALYQCFQEKISKELTNYFDKTKTEYSLEDKPNLHKLSAAFNETIRLTCSPVVPHVASKDSSIAGYAIEKGTVIFLNNHATNMSEKLWSKATVYDPTRFLDQNGLFQKPAHFQPFSMGRRSCIGYKMVQIITTSIVVNILQHFKLKKGCFLNNVIPLGMLAIPPGPFRFYVEKRMD